LKVDGFRSERNHGSAPFERLAELVRGAVVERAVRPFGVVLPAPVGESISNIVEGSEPARVEALVAQPAVEALDVTVLHRPARLDMQQLDLALFSPAHDAARGELRAVVRAHAFGPTTLLDQPVQHARYTARAEAGVGLQRQALARVIDSSSSLVVLSNNLRENSNFKWRRLLGARQCSAAA
jgi:hypothetical protein